MIASSPKRVLDLCSGAGGAGWGYHLAGIEPFGVDINPQPHYPGEFAQADALTFPLEGFDLIHVSAPCQGWSQATLSQRRRRKVYPDLVTPMRERLRAQSTPWVMENVPGAPVRADMELCGCMFGLELPGRAQLRRLRIIETSWHAVQGPVVHRHTLPAISIAGHGTPSWQRRLTGHITVADWRKVMDIGWMTREELTEAIPPVYATYIGREFLARRMREAA